MSGARSKFATRIAEIDGQWQVLLRVEDIERPALRARLGRAEAERIAAELLQAVRAFEEKRWGEARALLLPLAEVGCASRMPTSSGRAQLR